MTALVQRVDAETPAAPVSRLSMGRVALTVHDIAAVGAFYEKAVGLRRLRRDGETAVYGAGESPLLELRRDKAARRRSHREAGLFHTAFVLPTRGDLARWLRHAAETRAPIVGMSDHAVSEAIYLADPEGNGVEVYADRPSEAWSWRNGQVEMSTTPLNFGDLLANAGETSWNGAPDGSTVGHVHLQVGAIVPAESFYGGVLGFGVTARYPGGTFFAADGYHHHLATNIWNSRGAGQREYPSTGLAEVEIRIDKAHADAVRERAHQAAYSIEQDASRIVLHDPWNTQIVLDAS